MNQTFSFCVILTEKNYSVLFKNIHDFKAKIEQVKNIQREKL